MTAMIGWKTKLLIQNPPHPSIQEKLLIILFFFSHEDKQSLLLEASRPNRLFFSEPTARKRECLHGCTDKFTTFYSYPSHHAKLQTPLKLQSISFLHKVSHTVNGYHLLIVNISPFKAISGRHDRRRTSCQTYYRIHIYRKLPMYINTRPFSIGYTPSCTEWGFMCNFVFYTTKLPMSYCFLMGIFYFTSKSIKKKKESLTKKSPYP